MRKCWNCGSQSWRKIEISFFVQSAHEPILMQCDECQRLEVFEKAEADDERV
jgi:hypothetical protein